MHVYHNVIHFFTQKTKVLIFVLFILCIVNWFKLCVFRCWMLESAHSITPFCCISFKQFFFGFLIMMDNSCLLSIYHFHSVHSVHCELNSIKTVNQVKKSSCLCNLDMCSLCFKIGVSLYLRCYLYSLDTKPYSSSTAFTVLSSVSLGLTTASGTDDTIRASLWEGWVGSACVSCVFSFFLPTNVQSWGKGCPDFLVDHCQICWNWETHWKYWDNQCGLQLHPFTVFFVIFSADWTRSAKYAFVKQFWITPGMMNARDMKTYCLASKAFFFLMSSVGTFQFAE